MKSPIFPKNAEMAVRYGGKMLYVFHSFVMAYGTVPTHRFSADFSSLENRLKHSSLQRSRFAATDVKALETQVRRFLIWHKTEGR